MTRTIDAADGRDAVTRDVTAEGQQFQLYHGAGGPGRAMPGRRPSFARSKPERVRLQELLAKKQKGLPIAAAKKSAPNNVVNLIDALRASLKSSGKGEPAAKPAKAAKKTAKQKRKAG